MSAPNQLSFESMSLPPVSRAKRMKQARAAADDAIGRAADRVDRESPEWIAAALQSLRQFARNQSAGAWTIEMARGVIEPTLPKCGDLRVWGHVCREAVKAGYIERVKGAYALAASSHGCLKPLWRQAART